MKPATIITLLTAWLWVFQGCDNKHSIAVYKHTSATENQSFSNKSNTYNTGLYQTDSIKGIEQYSL